MNGVGRGSEEKQDKNKSKLATRETVGMTFLLFGGLLFLIVATGQLLFGDVGRAITAFFLGFAGFYVYFLLLAFIYLGIFLVSGKKLLPKGWTLRIVLLVTAVFFIVHTATAERFFVDPVTSGATGFGAYISGCFHAASERAADGTGGGFLIGLICYPVRFLFQAAGAYVIFALLLAAAIWFTLLKTPLKRYLLPGAKNKETQKKEAEPIAFDDIPAPDRTPMPDPAVSEPAGEREAFPASAASTSASTAAYSTPSHESTPRSFYGARQMDERERGRSILFSGDPAANYRENLIYSEDSRFNTRPRRSSVLPKENYSDSYAKDPQLPDTRLPRRVTEEKPAADSGYTFPIADENYPQKPTFRAPIERVEARDRYANDIPVTPEQPAEPVFPPLPETPFAPRSRDEDFGLGRLSREEKTEEPVIPTRDREDGFGLGRLSREEKTEEPVIPTRDREDGFGLGRLSREEKPEEPAVPTRDREDGFGLGRFPREEKPEEPEAPAQEELGGTRVPEGLREGSRANLFDDDKPLDDPVPDPEPAAPQRKEVPKKKKHVWKKYKRPSTDLLNTYEDRPTLSNEEVGRNSGIILDTLRRYKIETHIIGVKAGASVTRYDLAMPESGTISNVTRYDEELAVYLQVKGVNMYANPEVRGISVEVPNDKRSTVGLRSVLESEEFRKDSPDALLFALGQDVEGRPVCGNVTEMTHILVAGMTGSGKSIAMHAMLISLLFKYSPEELRLILIDPKQTEFALYEGIPHLMINEIITQAPKAVAALNWAVAEMERRYTLFNEKTRSGIAVSKIDEYNLTLNEDEERLPKILVVVDEFSDLMMTARKEVEERIQRLAQKARAAGIHLVLATQRPDATVITGVIKSNLPTRISLSVDSDLNSRIMLDESGAEKLLGLGDMLIKTTGKPRRAQGAFISAPERQRVINFIRENNETYFDDSVAEAIDKPDGGGQNSFGGDDSVNETYIKALGVVVKRGQASISLIQRSLGIGYNHAGKIIEWMESQGFISSFEGSKARTVLLTKEEYESRYGGMD